MSLARLDALRRATANAELHAVVIMPGPNMRYVTGLQFHLSERPVLAVIPPAEVPAILVPGLEENKARSAPSEWRLYTYEDGVGPSASAAALVSDLSLDRAALGVESRRFRFLEQKLLEAAGCSSEFHPADEVFARPRMRKEQGELDAMRKAVDVAQAALAETLPALRAGVSEGEVAAELTAQLLRAGSEPELPFSPLVASGPNGADPHGFPTNRQLLPGDVVTIDWGASIDGYFSDITRMFAIAGADPDETLLKACRTVRAANAAGRAAARPGATGQDVDRAARKVIVDAGLGEYFVHRTGHGLGLEGHEEPYMAEGSDAELAKGMTFTVEPGVYIPGLGGARIEDDVVVTRDGSECLTTLSRRLIQVG
jgi:Xaa-Pro dipeptidase